VIVNYMVPCPSCGSRWDLYRLVTLIVSKLKGRREIVEIPKDVRLDLGRKGWEFGDTFFDVKKCPRCGKRKRGIITSLER